MNIAFLLNLLVFLSFSPPEIDLLKGKDLFGKTSDVKAGWLGYIKSNKSSVRLTNVPMLVLNKADNMYAKIICVPKKPSEWNAKFIGKTNLEKASITKTLVTGIYSHALGANVFKIFALVETIIQPEQKSVVKKDLVQKFPSKVTVYSNSGNNWIQIVEKTIYNSAEYQDFQYEIAKNY
ncbi:hypothetical protein [Pedobacter sp. Leaf170]|uniref:hypothetical protein n=1 Tax=Pedobacter sp. Leaf170 TaxID=2876558 RepID=UPI001E570A9E|nr:hypothetical protein [Pedobacter sp. Leaf170]